MKKINVLFTSFSMALFLSACANSPIETPAYYEGSNYSLFNELPENADRSTPKRQLDLMSRGKYLAIGGEILPIPRAMVISHENSESFRPSRGEEEPENSEAQKPINIRIIDIW